MRTNPHPGGKPGAIVRRVSQACLVSGILFLVACGSPGKETRSSVAEVNGEAISLEAFEAALAPRKAALDPALWDDPAARRALKRRVLNELITRRLLLQEAARRGIAPSDEEVERRLAELSQGYSRKEWEELVAEQGIPLEGFRRRVAEDLTIERLLQEVAGDTGEPSDQEVEAYYREHLAELRRPVRARAFHLVVSSAEEARRHRQAILSGKEFSEIARRYSLGPEAVRGGELGWVSPGQVPEAFEKAIFALKPGELSPVVASPYGYHLFKLVALEPGGLPSLKEARAAIVERLKARARDARVEKLMEELRSRARLEVYLEVVERAE